MKDDRLVATLSGPVRRRQAARALGRWLAAVVVGSLMLLIVAHPLAVVVYAALLTGAIYLTNLAWSRTRLVLDDDGVRFEEGSWRTQAGWADLTGVEDEVASPLGPVTGLRLARSAEVLTRSGKTERMVEARGWHHGIPVGLFDEHWQAGPIGEAVRRRAPGVVPER